MNIEVTTEEKEKFVPVNLKLTFESQDELYSFMTLINQNENKLVEALTYKGSFIKNFTFELWDAIKVKTGAYRE